MYIEIIKALKERAKEMLEDNYKRKIGDEEIYTIICELENFYTAYNDIKTEHKIMKRIIVENGLWERLLNDDEFIKHLEEE